MPKNSETTPLRNLPWLVEQLPGFEEKTIRRHFDKILEVFGIDKEEMKTNGKIVFDDSFAEVLLWTFKRLDNGFLYKKLSGLQPTIEEVHNFSKQLYEFVETFEEPDRSIMLKYTEPLILKESSQINKNTTELFQEIAALFLKLPSIERLELLKQVNPHLVQFKEELTKRSSIEA